MDRKRASGGGVWSLDLIRDLEWKRFEDFCAAYFETKGYLVKPRGIGADNGIDFFLYNQDVEAPRLLGVVQCKAWRSFRVGVKPVRELLGVMTDRKCDLGVLITTSTYTLEAEQFASGKYIQLLNAERMLALVLSLTPAQQAALHDRVASGDYKTPSCPGCAVKLVLRIARKGKSAGDRFWGCPNYPRCRFTMKIPKSEQEAFGHA